MEGGDPEAYWAQLKRDLDLYCAAVARNMEASQQNPSFGYLSSQASDTTQLVYEASPNGDGYEEMEAGGRYPNAIKYQDAQGKPNAKRMRRMLLNRESARRSRKRKLDHLNDLESQVSQLSAENVSLQKSLADMTQKYKKATEDNINLMVNVEALRTKILEVMPMTSNCGYVVRM
ncbi:hypothetical protein U9M48_020341 [Paspalum notatum var. saurae]|uniref:BZIP domain-containing protein n=1 Tax=Paspalum notatum var. saurae TaxID=547442 RepID=A0AAQ3TD56_PASNO